uniref:Uncharacterized protein n=1 Tax=Anguilla anguilla TaxID=7936 RepID=A0A0E9VAI9_ANGAN
MSLVACFTCFSLSCRSIQKECGVRKNHSPLCFLSLKALRKYSRRKVEGMADSEGRQTCGRYSHDAVWSAKPRVLRT